MLTKIFAINKDMFVGGTHTSYRYTPQRKLSSSISLHLWFDQIKWILCQVPNNNCKWKQTILGFTDSTFVSF